MRHTVTDADTAMALGSGEVPVLATPRLVAWMEAATLDAARPVLEAGETTVGTSVRVAHRRPTPVGGVVVVEATLVVPVEGRTLTFTVRAVDDAGRLVAEGEIDRVVVDRDRFLART